MMYVETWVLAWYAAALVVVSVAAVVGFVLAIRQRRDIDALEMRLAMTSRKMHDAERRWSL
jgi:hypothetical protein